MFREWIPLYVVCCILNVFALQTSQEQARRDGWIEKWNKYWEDPAVFEKFLEATVSDRKSYSEGNWPAELPEG